MTPWILMFGALYLVHQTTALSGENCSKDEHQKCISLADPLLKDPQLIFPDNMKDIDNVCRTWSNFVDCIRRYTEKCFSKDMREQFNSAVEVSIESIHQMCSVSAYQAEYLQYASCIKATVIESEHCGNQYAALVNEVSRSEVVKPNLCCAHYHFRTCVIMETRKRCDGNQPEGTAAKFSRQILDKALSFLQEECANYIPNSGNCPLSMMDNTLPLSVSPLGESTSVILGVQSRPYQRTASPDIYSSKTSDLYGAFPNTAYPTAFKSTGRALNLPSSSESRSNNDVQPFSVQMPSNTPEIIAVTEKAVDEPKTEKTTERVISTTVTENNNNINNINNNNNNNNNNNDEESAVVVTQRSPTYGRGMAWTTQATKTSSEIPAWATSTWLASNQIPVTEDSWYPAAGSFGGNNIDEPNQQGLSKNSQIALRNTFIVTILLLSVVFIF